MLPKSILGSVTQELATAGLDPHIGVMHRENYNRPAFVFDAIEPFRPWVDRLVAELAIGGEMKSNWFDKDGKKVWLTTKGKRTLIPAWYGVMLASTDFLGKSIKRKDQIQQALLKLAQGLLPKNKTP